MRLPCGTVTFGAGVPTMALMIMTLLWSAKVRAGDMQHCGEATAHIPQPSSPPLLAGFSRLAGGDSECSGRLEVRQGRTWVSVCHGHVDLRAAQIVCREQGCGTAMKLKEVVDFQAVAGPFYDGAFKCKSTEPLLSACTQQPPHIQNCTQPTAIICSRKCKGCGYASAPCSVECSGGPSFHQPLSLLQHTLGSGLWMEAQSALGGWRWRHEGCGGPCVPLPGTCLMPTSSATTWAVALLSLCPHQAILGPGQGYCCRMPSDAVGVSGTRASATWRCWDSPPAPPGTLLPSTAQVGVETIESSRWGALPDPKTQPCCCRCHRTPAASQWGEPVRWTAGGGRTPRCLGPCVCGAVGQWHCHRGVPAAGLRCAGESLCCTRQRLGPHGAAGAALCWHRGAAGTL
uniref:SRCR domain-containing protein n=1 Tax=Phasianus colchicus TaxID=9054 RepID=A0A669QNM9_PHACC